jgi:peptidoglycan/xylan/chitin deacetylase (PgdA/CDA1 family)
VIRPLVRQIRERLHSTSRSILNTVSNPLIVLIYHRVISLEADPQMLAVHPDRFREQLQALQSFFSFRRFEEPWSAIDRPTLAITFDDGYADNLQWAMPILEELQIPATFFIASGYVGNGREFWWDELERLLLEARGGEAVRTLGPLDLGRTYDCAKSAERLALYRAIHPKIKLLTTQAREHVLADLGRSIRGAPDGRESHRVLSVPELRALADSPVVTIGAHTVSHQPLSSLSASAQRSEIVDSRASLVEWIGAPVDVFSYPFGGRSDYDRQAVQICRDCGFTRVASNFPAVVRPWTDPLQTPRFLVRDWNGRELMRRLKFFAGL